MIYVIRKASSKEKAVSSSVLQESKLTCGFSPALRVGTPNLMKGQLYLLTAK